MTLAAVQEPLAEQWQCGPDSRGWSAEATAARVVVIATGANRSPRAGAGEP